MSISMTERRSDFEDDGIDTSLHQDPHVQRAGRFRRQMRIGGREIEAGRAVIGSARGVDVVIEDPTVSRLHAEVEIRDDGLWLKDLGSTNGTFVGSVRIESALEVKRTDEKLRICAPATKVSREVMRSARSASGSTRR